MVFQGSGREAIVNCCMDQMQEMRDAAVVAAAADRQEGNKYDMADHSRGSLLCCNLNA